MRKLAPITNNIVTITGSQPGPVVAIFAGVHGNERAGVYALQRLIPDLKITKGTVHFAFANPPAIEANVRMVTKNLNRCFYAGNDGTDAEDIRARELMQVLDGCDALLDLHMFYDKKNKPFVICEDNADIVTILKMQIEEAGYETDIAYNLGDAQRKIKTNNYSAITLDLLYSMGGSGLKFISELRADSETKNLPIIVVSIAAQDGKAMMNANAFGKIDWLEKPIDEKKLKKALDRAVVKN
jgi:CheY-like chemotaxis protein